MPGLDSPTRWLILIALVVVLFGYKKLPEVTRSVGRSLRIFKTEMKGLSEDDDKRGATTPGTTSQSAVSPAAPEAEVHTTPTIAATPAPIHSTPPVDVPVPSPNGTSAGQPTTPGTV